ncbi:MAG: preprotein translocase subunit SecG [Lachnospiraceae bacterium]|nr:preprotein translocase subunit SecG [Lachnospiraceae bacterium]
MKTTIAVILTIILVLVCIALVVTVLLQEGKNAGLGSLAGMNNTDTYWGKHKAQTLEGRLEKMTKVLVAAFMIIALILNLKLLH